jgi:Kef-type K+ transport system membrane component KefB
MSIETVYSEFAILLAVSAVVGAIAVRLKQPLIIAYILVGILAGPAGFGWVQAHEQIDLLAQIGITVLLFLVGLKLDLQYVRHIGPVALATGLGQLAFTILFGFFIVLLLGKDWMTALYVAVALTFSSTIIIVKLLTDKRELDSLHGRIAIGFLIVQDIAVVVAMMTVSAMRATEGELAGGWHVGLGIALRIVAAGVLIYLLMRYILPWLVDRMARAPELLLIFAIAWGTAFAALGEWTGFSKEAGAFLAGFTLASSGYREAVSAKLGNIRDFLLLFFFLDLGAKLDFSVLEGEIGPAVVLSLFVLIGNPLIVMAIMGYMGYRKRTGFLAGLTVAQISEFSIIFIAMGIALGHVGLEALGLTTLVGLITITLSTYMILNSQFLYAKLERFLRPFERRRPFREVEVEQMPDTSHRPDVIVFGLGRYGSRLAARLHDAGLEVIGVDFDPEVARSLRRRGIPVLFGDGADEQFLDTLPLRAASWIFLTLPRVDENVALLDALPRYGYRKSIAALAREEGEAAELEQAGASRVFYPFQDAADFAAREIALEARALTEP